MRFRLFGRSEAIRTPGLLDPNQARYQLRYTPISCYIIMTILGNVKAWEENLFLFLRQKLCYHGCNIQRPKFDWIGEEG